MADMQRRCGVLPLTREWIEITLWKRVGDDLKVLPLTREWIEIILQK